MSTVHFQTRLSAHVAPLKPPSLRAARIEFRRIKRFVLPDVRNKLIREKNKHSFAVNSRQMTMVTNTSPPSTAAVHTSTPTRHPVAPRSKRNGMHSDPLAGITAAVSTERYH